MVESIKHHGKNPERSFWSLHLHHCCLSRQLSHIPSVPSRLQKFRVLKEGWDSRSSSFHMQMWLSDREKKGGRGIFSSSAADSLHSVLWEEKCVLWQSPEWFPQLRNPLSSHSHGSVLHSVLTPTSRFYRLNRGINSTKTELPKILSAVQLQQVPVTASLVSVLWWLQGEGAHSKAALNQITWAPRAKPALQVEKEHWTLRNVCGMFSL